MHLHKLLAIAHMHALVALIAQHGAIRKEDPTPPELVVEGRVAFVAVYVAVFVAQPPLAIEHGRVVEFSIF
tara:strand:+ start:171 stop:383 length:213 start_codon:yes stop_codon:yes gene_type:complete